LLRRSGHGENYHEQKEKKERTAPVACHTFLLLRLFLALWSLNPHLAILFWQEVTLGTSVSPVKIRIAFAEIL
ncbi:MAG TPA: hypothetical protein VG488_04655, partial [Candidatus Angelobacter sp.]|nr:hypothetical protein [Candidatus Angelobacter sp.]